jgi:hypothetical protein
LFFGSSEFWSFEMAMKKLKHAQTAKSSVRRRARMVEGSQQAGSGVPGSDQDAKRRLGNFESAGEHARVGGRTSGIVGQRTRRFRTELRKKSS